MDVYLIRHGETFSNKKRKLQGQVDTRLTPKGIRQAQLASEGMKDIPFDCIYASPLGRARMTAEIIRGERDLPIRFDERLKEIDFGPDNGRYIDKAMKKDGFLRYQRFFRDPVHYRPRKGGESYYDVLARADDFWKNELLPLEGRYNTVLVAAHATLIRCFILSLTGRPLDDLWKSSFGRNCEASIFRISEGCTEMVCENRMFWSEEDLL